MRRLLLLSLLVAAVGCQRSPTYDEALQTFDLEIRLVEIAENDLARKKEAFAYDKREANNKTYPDLQKQSADRLKGWPKIIADLEEHIKMRERRVEQAGALVKRLAKSRYNE